jgi:hypothetical protein
MSTTVPVVPEDHRITGAFSKGKPVPFYDDGDGNVFVFFLSCGPWLYPAGVVRARTWEDAWLICEDEFCDEADETVEELKKEYGFVRTSYKIIRDPSAVAGGDPGCDAGERWCRSFDYVDGRLPEGLFIRWYTHEVPEPEAWVDNELFNEAYGFRPNGPRTSDKLRHGIFQKDFNARLDGLSPEIVETHELTLTTEPW